MKIIGVLSDTHLFEPEDALKSLFDIGGILYDCDVIVHAGDFTSLKVYEFLKSQNNFYGVQGNMDEVDIRRILPIKRIILLEGVRIGITHGWGAPFNLDSRVYEFFNNPSLDCIIFGHSHSAENKIIGKTLMFNPGSYKGQLMFSKRSVGKLYLENGFIRGEIIKL